MKVQHDGMDRSCGVVSAGTMTGDPVKGLEGEDLGRIEEIMLDSSSGRIVCAVLSFGGFLGTDDRLFAVPWAALRMDKTRDELILNMDQSVLEQAPGFDESTWPDFSDPAWRLGIRTHCGATA
jgi:uncharacterized protein YrrD